MDHKLEIRNIVQDWVPTLKSHLTEEMDRATFSQGHRGLPRDQLDRR